LQARRGPRARGSGQLRVSDEFGDSREKAPASLRLGEARNLPGPIHVEWVDSVTNGTGDGPSAHERQMLT